VDEQTEYLKSNISQTELNSKKYTDESITSLNNKLSESIKNTSIYAKDLFDNSNEYADKLNNS